MATQKKPSERTRNIKIKDESAKNVSNHQPYQSAEKEAAISAALPIEGYVRLKQIIGPHGPIPVSAATWWEGVRTGRFPQPTKVFGPGITAWNVADIRKLLMLAAASTMMEKSTKHPSTTTIQNVPQPYMKSVSVPTITPPSFIQELSEYYKAHRKI